MEHWSERLHGTDLTSSSRVLRLAYAIDWAVRAALETRISCSVVLHEHSLRRCAFLNRNRGAWRRTHVHHLHASLTLRETGHRTLTTRKYGARPPKNSLVLVEYQNAVQPPSVEPASGSNWSEPMYARSAVASLSNGASTGTAPGVAGYTVRSI
jgi:hypothetical protein